MKRVLEVVLNAEGTVGGEQRHVLHIIDGLDRERIDVDVVTWDIPEFVAELDRRRVNSLSVTGTRVLDRRMAARLAEHIRQRRYDLVHAHGHRAGLIGRLAAVRAGAPAIVWTCHVAENKADRNAVLAGAYALALRRLARRTDAIIAVSAYMRDWLVDTGIPGELITTVPNCIDTRAFAPRSADARLADELGLDLKRPVVGTVARLSEQKGLDWLIDSIPAVLAAVPDTQFIIVGGGPLAAQLAAQVEHRGATDAVRFAGQRADVADVVATFDVGVVPSRWEGGFSLVPLEMMALRKPVICSDIRCFTDVITDGKDGLIVPFGSTRAFADAVIGLLREPGHADALAREGHALVRREFDLPVMQRRTGQLYDALLCRNGVQ